MGGVATGAAAGVFFQVCWMWGAVGTQKKSRMVADCRFNQCQAMRFAFENGEAVVMWPNTARKKSIAVVQQVVRSDGRRGECIRITYIMRSLACSDVLKHDFELREVAPQRDQLGVDKHCFAVKQVNVW